METLCSADITWDDAGQPVSRTFADIYFSSSSGIDESRFVFLQHNQLEQRWRHLPPDTVFTVAETGFGSGLNFLTAWQSWQKHAPADATLHFISVEKFPLVKRDLRQALHLWPELQCLSDQLIEQYPPVDARGFHRLHFDRVHLTLIYADAVDGLEQLLSIHQPGPMIAGTDCGWSPYISRQSGVDAWFLDGFAPSKNPQMWSPELFNLMARLSHTDTTFATFTAAGAVRQGLQQAGFAVRKTPGFGPKRDMTCGRFIARQPSLPAVDPQSALPAVPVNRYKASPSWHLCQRRRSAPHQIAVIGAGLAGCHSAYALAQQGFKVTLIDRADIAAGASGNPRGVVYSKLSSTPGVFADFNLAAFTYALRFYHQQQLFSRCGNPCGVLQLPENLKQAAQQKDVAHVFQQSPDLVQWLDQERSSAIAGVALHSSALWLPQAGWMNPPVLCRTLAQHPNIRVLTHRQIDALEHVDEQWLLLDDKGNCIMSSPAVVVACADSARRFSQCSALPIKAIRGQISMATPSFDSRSLRTVLCGHGYIAPEHKGQHVLGASFNLNSQSAENQWDEHQDNLQHVHALSPALEDLEVASLADGRVSFRCTTPDYLPLVGPVAHHGQMTARFGAYRKHLKATVDAPGEHWPGLFINVGHGSKGLTYTPLCAQLLACMISNQPLPLSRHLALHVHPARFIIRDLSRRRI